MLTAQFGRYVAAGFMAVALHFAVLIALVELFAIAATPATAVGFLLACLANYLMQRAWVFEAARAHKVFLPRYVMVTAVTFALNIAIFWLLHRVIGLWYPAAQFIAYGLIFLLNFVVNRQYTFREPPADAS